MVYKTHQVSIINDSQYIGCFLSHNNFVNLSSNVFVTHKDSRDYYLIFDSETDFASIGSISKAHNKYKNPVPLKNNKIINNSSSNLIPGLATRKSLTIRPKTSPTVPTVAIRPITRVSNPLDKIPKARQVENTNPNVQNKENHDDDDEADESDEETDESDEESDESDEESDESDEKSEVSNEIKKELNFRDKTALKPTSKLIPVTQVVVPSKKFQTEILKTTHKIKRIAETIEELRERKADSEIKSHKAKLQNIINSLDVRKGKLERSLAQFKIKQFTNAQAQWEKTPEGKRAIEFCKSRGAHAQSLVGCLEDMRIGKNKLKATNAIKLTNKVVSLDKKALRTNRVIPNPDNKLSTKCTAVGDPHYTNFNGEYIHLQQPGIFTMAKSTDELFEVQIKQDGYTKPGTPSYIRAAKIKYNDKVYDNNFKADGFEVKTQGNTIEITVPGAYQNSMQGLCGSNGPTASNSNYKFPNGMVADVDWGKPNWTMGGWGGPTSKMSRWQLSWKPTQSECLFSKSECVVSN